MIALLARITAADADAGAQPLATERDRGLLGWQGVTAQAARHCRNRRAAQAVAGQLPYTDLGAIELWRALADELKAARDRDQRPPLADISAVMACLEAPPSRPLEGGDLVAVARLAEDLDRLREWLLRWPALLPLWSAAAREAATFAGLVAELRRCLDRDGRLQDGASPLLGRLRRLAREREQQVRESVAKAMAEANRRGWTAGEEVTLRGDRFCLPLRAADRRKVAGIVHDRSQTGQTIYVEPAATVQLANDLAECRLEIAAEETRILHELNQRVREQTPALLAAGGLLLLVDRVQAVGAWAAARRAGRPQLAPGGSVRIAQGRHPLLEQALAEQTRATGAAAAAVVPLDLELPPAVRVLVISGPNAGGKSVALKTVGVLVMLAQCGWDVPAREDTRLPLVRRIFVDLGDEQSIESSLSSFSAHLSHLQRFLQEADGRSLVLCDEIGAGTDPQEGTALAFTVLEQLAVRGALVLASTHYGLLKAAVHDHPAMINAAMDYDEVSLAPRFRLRLGDPGASHAFDIAARVGLDPPLLARARAMVGQERYQLEKLLRELAARARDLAAQEAELRTRLDAAQAREAQLREQSAELARRHEAERESLRQQGQELLREARQRLAAAVREVRIQGGRQEAVDSVRAQIQAVASRLPAPPAPEPGPADLTVGDRVRIAGLGLQGRVVEIRGDKIGVLADGLNVSIDRSAVARLDDVATPASGGAGGSRESAVAWTWDHDDPGIPCELDLRGLQVEEAWLRVDKLLDRALPVGLAQLTIIHGMGSGRLRDQLLSRLAADPRVARCHPAGERGSNLGATVVHLS